MWTVVLTGGIGSGKSTVAEMFAALGATSFNADAVVRQLLLESNVQQQLIRRWGDEIVLGEAQDLRQRLKTKLLGSRADQQWLEEMLHPLVAQRLTQIRQKPGNGSYLLAEIPLYFRMQSPPEVDRILLVDCPMGLRIARLRLGRPKLTDRQIQQFIALQTVDPESGVLAQIDDTIDNSGSLAQLQQQVSDLHRRYLVLAGAGL